MPSLAPVQARWLTPAFTLIMTAVVTAFDVCVIRAYGVDASISRVFRRPFGASPTLFVAAVFWLGILVGHIWLPTE